MALVLAKLVITVLIITVYSYELHVSFDGSNES